MSYLEKTYAYIAKRWRDLSLGIKGVFVIALPLLVLFAALASLYLREQQSVLLESKLETALQNQRDIQTVHTLLLEASTGVRDYLLTGDKHSLHAFSHVKMLLPQTLAQLQSQLEDETQKQNLGHIKVLALQNLADLQTISQYESNIASTQLIQQFKSQVSTLETLRAEIDSLSSQEAMLVAQDQQAILAQRQRNIVITLIAAITGIIGSLGAAWVFSNTIVKRVRSLRDSAGHLAKAEALELPIGSRDELGQLSQELDHASQLLAKQMSDALLARQAAEEASAAKSMFLSRTSHELRTPLNAILGFAQLLEEELTTGKQRDSAALIAGAGQHLLKLINEVLEIARIEAGEIDVPLSPVEINPLLEEAISFIAPIGKIRDITINSQITPNLYAHANRQKLLQVMLNLLSNAIKYGPANAAVQVNAYQRDTHIVIEVADSGTGIASNLRTRLFTPFDRLGAEHSKVEGTGLGLALSKQMMLAMQGSIHMADDKSLFWLEIASSAQSHVNAQTKPNHHPNPQLTQPHPILYVDSDLSRRALVEAIIQRQPDLSLHCTAIVGDAPLLLAKINPSLVIIDVDLVDADTLVAHIRTDYQTIPMIILSANALPEAKTPLKQAHYISKPLDVAVFNKAVRELIFSRD